MSSKVIDHAKAKIMQIVSCTWRLGFCIPTPENLNILWISSNVLKISKNLALLLKTKYRFAALEIQLIIFAIWTSAECAGRYSICFKMVIAESSL
jgi:hypothetical protein